MQNGEIGIKERLTLIFICWLLYIDRLVSYTACHAVAHIWLKIDCLFKMENDNNILVSSVWRSRSDIISIAILVYKMIN